VAMGIRGRGPGGCPPRIGPPGAHATGLAELADRDLAEDAETFLGVAVEQATGLRATLAVRGRLHRQDTDGVDIVVGVTAGVCSLVDPVHRGAVLRCVERVESLEAAGVIAAARPRRRNATLRYDSLRIALALVQARRADQAEGRPLRQVRGAFAVIGERG